MSVRALIPTVAVSLLACGEAPPPTAPSVPAPPVASVVAPREPAPELGPVPPPGDLSATVRIAHPRAMARRITELLGSQGAALGADKMDPEELVGTAAGAPIGAAVDLDQSIDIALAHADVAKLDVRVVAGAALKDLSSARPVLEKYFTLSPGKSGVIRLEPREDPPDGATPRPCLLAPTRGGGMRLVCGDTIEALQEMAPYVARTLPGVATTHDVRIEAFVHHVWKADSDALLPKPDDDGAAGKAATEMMERMAHDFDTVLLELTLDAQTADVALGGTFTGDVSPLTRALVGQALPAAPPPDAFERLPKATETAWFARGTPAGDLAPVRALLFTALRASLAEDGFTPAQSDAQMAPLEATLLTGGPWMMAGGHALDAARAALGKYVAGKSSPASREKARAAAAGWFLAEVDEPAAKWTDAFKEVARLDPIKPAGKPTRKKKPDEEHRTMRLAPVPAGLGLPAGTLHAVFHVTENAAWLAEHKKDVKPQDVPPPHDEHLFIVPDGDATWFAAADDAALAAGAVAASLRTAAPGGQLRSRPDLGGLRKIAMSAGGFGTVAGAAMFLSGAKNDQELKRLEETLEGLAGLKDGGQTPVPLWITARPAEGGAAHGGTLRLELAFPLGVATDVAASQKKIF